MWRNSTAAKQVQGKFSSHVPTFPSYTTHIHCEKDDLAISALELQVSSSEWQYLTINNVVYSVDPQTPVGVSTDAMGNVTILAQAGDAAPPVLHVSSPHFAEILNVYANGKVHKHMDAIKSGQDLKGALGQDGKPVVAADADPSVVNGVATRTSAVYDVASKEFAPSQQKNTFVSVEHTARMSARGLKHTLATPIAVEHFTSEIFLAVKFDRKCRGFKLWEEHEARAHVAGLEAAGLLGGAFDWIGDALHFIEHAAEAAVTAVVDAVVEVVHGLSFVLSKIEDGLQFMMTVAGKAVKFVVKTFVEAFKVINTLLKLIGIDLGALLRWLGHLLGWDKIWDTHKIIASTPRSSLTFRDNAVTLTTATDMLTFGKKNVGQYLESAKTQVHNSFANVESKLSGLTAATQTYEKSKVIVNSPQGNLAYYHLSNAVSTAPAALRQPRRAIVASPHVPEGSVSTTSGPFAGQFSSIIAPIAARLVQDLGNDAGDLVSLIKSGSNEDARKLLLDLLKTFFDPVEILADTVLDVLGESLGSLGGFMNDDLELPVLGAMYELVTGLMGEEEDFNGINGTSFILALAIVPTLSTYDMTQLYDLNNVDCTSANFPARLQATITSGFRASRTFKTAALRNDPRSFHQIPSLGGDAPIPPEGLEDYSLIAGVISTVLSCAAGIVNVVPKESISSIEKLMFLLTIGSDIFSFPMPSDGQPADTWAQRIGIWLFGTAVDALTTCPSSVSSSVSGIFDNNKFKGETVKSDKCKAMLQLVVQIPRLALLIEVDVREGANTLSWFADMLAQLSGIVGSCADATETEEVKMLALALVLFSAPSSFGAIAMDENQKKIFNRIL